MSIQPTPRDGRFVQPGKVTPADRLIAQMDGVYYRMREVSDITGISMTTLRRYLKKPELKAPSFTAEQGGMQMYLYTPEDIEELREYNKGRARGKETTGEDS